MDGQILNLSLVDNIPNRILQQTQSNNLFQDYLFSLKKITGTRMLKKENLSEELRKKISRTRRLQAIKKNLTNMLKTEHQHAVHTIMAFQDIKIKYL